MKQSRREILAGIAAATIVTAAGAGGAAFLLRPGFEHPAVHDLLALLPDRHAAARMGADWLGRHGTLASSWDALPKMIEARLSESGWEGGDAAALRRQVAGIVRAEFDQGAIEDVDGWRISRFQAQLCGLACLDASRPKA